MRERADRRTGGFADQVAADKLLHGLLVVGRRRAEAHRPETGADLPGNRHQVEDRKILIGLGYRAEWRRHAVVSGCFCCTENTMLVRGGGDAERAHEVQGESRTRGPPGTGRSRPSQKTKRGASGSPKTSSSFRPQSTWRRSGEGERERNARSGICGRVEGRPGDASVGRERFDRI